MHLKGSDHQRQTQFITVTDQIPSTRSCCHFLKRHISLTFTSCEQVSCCPDKPQSHPRSPKTHSCLSGSFFVSLMEFRNCWLHFLPPFPAHHPVWFNMCVDVIALGWKGLASNNDAKKKKKFPSYSTCTYNEMICIILTRVYYCWGLPSSFEGYFVLPAANSWITEVIALVSLV